MRRILGLLVILLVVSCGSTESSLDSVFGTEQGHFQGVSIGDEYRKVSKNVAGTTVLKDEGLIACEYEVADASVAVRYVFDGTELYSIQAELFFLDTSALKSF